MIIYTSGAVSNGNDSPGAYSMIVASKDGGPLQHWKTHKLENTTKNEACMRGLLYAMDKCVDWVHKDKVIIYTPSNYVAVGANHGYHETPMKLYVTLWNKINFFKIKFKDNIDWNIRLNSIIYGGEYEPEYQTLVDDLAKAAVTEYIPPY